MKIPLAHKHYNTNRLISIVMSAILIMACSVTALGASEAEGRVIKLLKQQGGGVSVVSDKGREYSGIEGMRLFSGYKVKTDSKSYAFLSIDDTKAVKLDVNTSVEIRKQGSKSEIFLDAGKVFLSTDKKLNDKEKFQVTTSNMVMGVRGTGLMASRIIIYDPVRNRGIETISGQAYWGDVEVSFTNEGGTSETRQLPPGWQVSISSNAPNQLHLTDFRGYPSSIPSFVSEEILSNPEYKAQFESGTGITEGALLEIIEKTKANEDIETSKRLDEQERAEAKSADETQTPATISAQITSGSLPNTTVPADSTNPPNPPLTSRLYIMSQAPASTTINYATQAPQLFVNAGSTALIDTTALRYEWYVGNVANKALMSWMSNLDSTLSTFQPFGLNATQYYYCKVNYLNTGETVESDIMAITVNQPGVNPIYIYPSGVSFSELSSAVAAASSGDSIWIATAAMYTVQSSDIITIPYDVTLFIDAGAVLDVQGTLVGSGRNVVGHSEGSRIHFYTGIVTGLSEINPLLTGTWCYVENRWISSARRRYAFEALYGVLNGRPGLLVPDAGDMAAYSVTYAAEWGSLTATEQSACAFLIKNNIIGGIAPGDLGSNYPVNRGEMAAVLDRSLNALGISPPITNPGVSFHDVNPGYMFYDSIMRMAQIGCIVGFPDGRYRPYVDVGASPDEVMMYISVFNTYLP